MNKYINNPEFGTFPPHIENPAMNIIRTAHAGGNDIVYENGYLYLIATQKGGSLRILRAGEGEPVLLGELCGLGNMRQIEVSADAVPGRILAAMTARECGMYLVDVTDPEKPYICCHYNSVEFATGVTFGDHYLAIGCRSFGVELVDIAVPEKPRHICSIRAGEVQSVYIADGILYTGSWGERQVNLIDISNVRAPKKLATIDLEGRGDGLMVRDGILFAAFGQHRRPDYGRSPEEEGYGRGNGFAIWDVRDPAAPKQLSHTFLPHRYYCCNYDMWDVTVSGHYAVLSHTFNGVWIYDIADLTSPVLVDHMAVPAEAPMDKIITMNKATMELRPMILPFDIYTTSWAPVAGVAVTDGRLYAALKFQNLHIAEAAYFKEEKKPHAGLSESGEDYYVHTSGRIGDNVKIVRTEGQTHAAIVYGGLVWVACGMDGIGVYDTELNRLCQIPVPGFAMDIRERDGYFYIASGKSGVGVYRPDGLSLIPIGRLSIEERACAQAVPSENGRFLMVHTDDQNLTIVDVSDKANPRIAMREHYSPGLVYHRHLSHEGVMGRYYGCYWNGNLTRWYDLSGSEPVLTEFAQGKLGFPDGLTGLDTPYQSLAIVRGGYVIADIRDAREYHEYEVHKFDGLSRGGKPVVKDGILYTTDRLDGNVNIIDIGNPNAPKLLASHNFSGNPDLACPIAGGVIVPLGHQGLAKIKF